jgi:hypothetical protein
LHGSLFHTYRELKTLKVGGERETFKRPALPCPSFPIPNIQRASLFGFLPLKYAITSFVKGISVDFPKTLVWSNSYKRDLLVDQIYNNLFDEKYFKSDHWNPCLKYYKCSHINACKKGCILFTFRKRRGSGIFPSEEGIFMGIENLTRTTSTTKESWIQNCNTDNMDRWKSKVSALEWSDKRLWIDKRINVNNTCPYMWRVLLIVKLKGEGEA